MAEKIPFPIVDHAVLVAGTLWHIAAVEDQDKLLDGVRTDHDVEHFPYGLLLWGSAVGLAERLAENPSPAANRRVLEVGCGVGLAGLQAARLGGMVTQTDYLPEALNLAGRNAAANGVTGVKLFQADWRSFPPIEPFELVIGSDVLYERAMHPVLISLLPRIVAPGGSVLLSDPMRPQALDFVESLEKHGWSVEIDSRLIDWQGGRTEIALFSATAP